jgi:hypothetical protein
MNNTIERPGINAKWLKSRKAICKYNAESLEESDPNNRCGLEYFVRHGVTPFVLEHPITSVYNPPFQNWERMTSELGGHSHRRIEELEIKSQAGEAFDLGLAVRSFAAAYTSEMVSLHNIEMCRLRFGNGGGRGI